MLCCEADLFFLVSVKKIFLQTERKHLKKNSGGVLHNK